MWGNAVKYNRNTKGCKMESATDCCVTRRRQNQPEKSRIFGNVVINNSHRHQLKLFSNRSTEFWGSIIQWKEKKMEISCLQNSCHSYSYNNVTCILCHVQEFFISKCYLLLLAFFYKFQKHFKIFCIHISVQPKHIHASLQKNYLVIFFFEWRQY